MTRKDYVQAARLVAAIPKASCRENTAKLFVKFFAADNPRFDSDRFLFVCRTYAAVRNISKGVFDAAASAA